MTKDGKPVPGEKKTDAAEADRLGLGAEVGRRDFVGGMMIGAGAALLSAAAPGGLRTAFAEEASSLPPVRGAGKAWSGIDISDGWQGPGGVGDYAKSNGNTVEVVRAAHAGVRNHEFEKKLASAIDTNESYDLVVVGAGVSGLFAAYDLLRQKPTAKVLVLDNHAIFGGEAKHNQIDVDGYSLYAPQGPTNYFFGPQDVAARMSGIGGIIDLVKEINLPTEVTHTDLTGTDKPLAMGRDYWTAQGYTKQVDVGYFYDSKGFVRNPFMNGFRDAPIDQKIKDDIGFIIMNMKRPVEAPEDTAAWLDSMTYQEFLKTVYGARPETAQILERATVVGDGGLGADVYSATVGTYGTQPYGGFVPDKELHGICCPGGNSGVARSIVKKFLPEAIRGTTLTDTLFGPINWDELDKNGRNARIRLNATVVGVKQDRQGTVTYFLLGGKIHSVKSKAVVMASPQQVNRNICFDLPKEYDTAMAEFHHGPILVVNVAVRNWKFMEKANISAFRWFGDFPAFGMVERKIKVDGRDVMPCDPTKPTTISLYIPMNSATRGMPLGEQAIAARHVLFGLSYADIELLIREQFTKLFGSYGFDAKRDIAAIVTNRWGHAFVCPGPGFFYGKNGQPAPSSVIKTPWDKVAFSHSDLTGAQSWLGAVGGAREAVSNLLPRL